ncbi:MAG: ribosome maturation factor RimM [Treponema sp.]|jgi:16S rRNA processing protein RimM|nr:ribosome maturation factor RimM [Treponema sp.]
MTERFVAALVGPPFGLQGFVKVRSLSGEIRHLLNLRRLTLRRGGREQVWELEAAEAASSSLLMKFRGIDSPEAAKTLGGAEILLAREEAAPLRPGEYYIEDLKGVEVYAGTEALGTIADILEGGGRQPGGTAPKDRGNPAGTLPGRIFRGH